MTKNKTVIKKSKHGPPLKEDGNGRKKKHKIGPPGIEISKDNPSREMKCPSCGKNIIPEIVFREMSKSRRDLDKNTWYMDYCCCCCTTTTVKKEKLFLYGYIYICTNCHYEIGKAPSNYTGINIDLYCYIPPRVKQKYKDKDREETTKLNNNK